MTYRRGFIYGLIVGLFFIGISTGFVRATEEARGITQNIGTTGLILLLIISIIRPFKRGSVFNPYMDGFLTGFGLATKLYATALYGIRFP